MPPRTESPRRVLESGVPIRLILLLLSAALTAFPGTARTGEQNPPVRIIVAFQKTAGPDEIEALERRHALKMVSDLAAANSRVYLLTGPQSLPESLKAISAETIVRYAEIDQKVSIN